jgi:uncharacterized protein (DUF2147 family)
MTRLKPALTIVAAGLAGVLQLAGLGQAAAAAVIEGTWMTQGKTEITIATCPKGYCGAITKIVIPPDILAKYGDDIAKVGTNYTDQNNKDPALRGRPIQDLEILNVKAGNNPNKFEGELYNPQDGNIYGGYLEVLGPDRIKLNGCVLFNLVCMGEEWTRVIPPPDETTTTQ